MDPLFSDIPAAQALRGITLRVQRRPGPPDEFDDPFASEITVSGAQSDAVQQYAEDDLDMVLDESPMMSMMNRDTVNRTSYLENNYPIAAQAPASEEYDPLAMMGGDPSMMAAMMGGGDPAMMGGEEPMGPTGRRGRRNPAGIMKGLGF